MSAYYVVNYDIIETASGALVTHGCCWSNEVEIVRSTLLDGQAVRVLDDMQSVSKTDIQYSYGVVRKQEYPSVEEQLGAIWKVLSTLPAKNIPTEALEILKRIANVKASYDKGGMYIMNDGTDPTVRSRYKKIQGDE